MSDDGPFGVELRRARLRAGVSLRELAARVHYSKGHLSKIENGTKRATGDLAMRCDAALDAEGRLAALGATNPSAPVPALPAPPYPVRSDLGRAPAGDDPETLATLEAIFVQARRLGRGASPHVVLPGLLGQARMIQGLAGASRPAARGRLLALAAVHAEYAGWMAQESGDADGARWWTDATVRLATAAGDLDMVRYGRVRQAELSLYRGELPSAIAMLAEAQEGPTTARVAGLAAQWQAQAYALSHDHRRWRTAMDRAAELLVEPDETGTALGSSSVRNGHALATGWCLLELGRPEDAAELLDRELPLVPAQARRAAARFGARRALAYAAAGAPDTAVALLPDLLVLATQVDSATVRVDLRRLRHELVRWDARPAVARACTDLADVLLPG